MNKVELIKLMDLYARKRKLANQITGFPVHEEWVKHRDESAKGFSAFINSFPYKSDPLFGILDYTADPDRFYDRSVRTGRDCDDFARQWSLWGLWNDYKVTEVIATDSKRPISRSHIVTVLEKDRSFILCNYIPYAPQPTIGKAVGKLQGWKDDYNDLVWLISDRWESMAKLS